MKKNFWVVLSVLTFSFILSLFVLYTPIPKTSDTFFNTNQALSYIAEISETEHSVYDTENHETVRLYLKEKLGEFVGVENVVEMNYPASENTLDLTYDVSNLFAKIQGESDTGILLVAHYDSRGHIGRSGELGNSYGAADDGYGLAVLLEVARLYGTLDLTNSIYLLMTDAEETGLYGAKFAVKEDFMDKVNFVINIEARGTTGASYMFETSKNNEKVIDFYRHANLPVSYSIATAVYSVMPNYTDFTQFISEDINKSGVNFAVLDGFYHYHSPSDNLLSVDPSSIQHYGEQIIPLVDEYVFNQAYSDMNYFVGNQNQVFFTLLPNVFISYTETEALIITIILFVMFLATLIYFNYKKQITIKKVLLSLALIVGVMFSAAFFGFLVSKIVAFLGKTPWKLTYVRMLGTEIPALLTLLLVILGFVFVIKKVAKTKESQMSFLFAGLFLNFLLSMLTTLTLSGASFLFLIPAMIGFLSVLCSYFIKQKGWRHLLYSQTILFSVLILVPLFYSLFIALTIGGLLALSLLLVISCSILLPSIFIQLEM